MEPYTKPRSFVDPKSGLIYTQSVAKAVDMNWVRWSPGSLDKRRLPAKKGFGSASLKYTVIRKLARHVDSLRTGDLRHMPWPLVKPLWKYLMSNRLISVEVWKTFSTIYFAEDVDGSLGFRLKKFNASPFVRCGQWERALHSIISPPPPMSRGNNSITTEAEAGSRERANTAMKRSLSMRIEFLTVLEISKTSVSRLDLLFIPSIYNLYSLSIGPSVEVIQDRQSVVKYVDSDVFRSWSEAIVQDDQCFRALQFFSLEQREPPPSKIVQSLSRFPALTYMHIECVFEEDAASRFLARAKHNGWVKSGSIDQVDDYDIPKIRKSEIEDSNQPSARNELRHTDQQSKHPMAQNNCVMKEPCQASTLPIFHCQIIGQPQSEVLNNRKPTTSIRLERERPRPSTIESIAISSHQPVAFQDKGNVSIALKSNRSVHQDDISVREVKKPKLKKTLDTQDELLKLASGK